MFLIKMPRTSISVDIDNHVSNIKKINSKLIWSRLVNIDLCSFKDSVNSENVFFYDLPIF